jgi:DNA-binding transcriptional ArsR family regulator
MKAPSAISCLAALSHESRLEIYRVLVQAGREGLSVGEIGAPLRIAPATLSFHLKELVNAGLALARQQGRFIYYSANYERMNALIGYLTEKCCIQDVAACGAACGAAKTGAKAAAARGSGASRSTKLRTKESS